MSRPAVLTIALLLSGVSLGIAAEPEQPRGPLDVAVDDALAARSLTRNPVADRRTLARRLSFTLRGLPPTNAEVRAFIEDQDPLAWERLIDRWLASPAFGEHRAVAWLDAVGYADTNGYERDEFRSDAWRYRAYVVDSFNRDRSWWEFLRLQLIGDDLVREPFDEQSRDSVVATGFYRLGPRDTTQDIFGEASREREAWLIDITNRYGVAVLGLELDCARCHDHKLDAITQDDYVRLRDTFATLEPVDGVNIELAGPRLAIASMNRTVDDELSRVVSRWDRIVSDERSRLQQRRTASLPSSARLLLTTPLTQLTPTQRAERERFAALLKIPDDELLTGLPFASRSIAADLLTRRQHLRGLLVSPASAMSIRVTDREPPATGLTPPEAWLTGLPLRPTRRDVVRWAIDPQNDLVARAVVERVWRECFGASLTSEPGRLSDVASAEFVPVVRSLLMADFRKNGGSIKSLFRTVLNSASWRQSSAHREDAARIDPDNALLWRQNRQRLTAEMLRDARLQTTGELLRMPGRPPIWPAVPEHVLSAHRGIVEARIGLADGRLQDWYRTDAEFDHVRTLHLVRKRSVPFERLAVWDRPDPECRCEPRDETISTRQPLVTWRDDELRSSAETWAARLLSSAGQSSGVDDWDQIVHRAYLDLLQRPPSARELSAGREFLSGGDGTSDRLRWYCHALLNLNEGWYVD